MSKASKTTTTQKRKWDKTKALADYIADSTLSHSDIAKKYGISKSTVQTTASKENWAEQRRNATENAIENVKEKQAEAIADAVDRHTALFKNAQNIGNKMLVRADKEAGASGIPDAKAVATGVSAIKVGIEGERVILGQPNSVAAHTGSDGGDLWGGFAEMVRAAEKVLDGQDKS